MKKGIVVAVCAAVVAVVVAGGGWWIARDRGPVADAPDAGDRPARPLTEAQRAERSERIKQGIAHRRHLWREASYIEIRQAATDGDLVAQRRLSEVYEDCRALEGGMRSGLQLLDQLAASDPAVAQAVAGINRDKARLCGQANADLRNNPAAADFWLHKSAKSGDLVSEMRYFSRTVPKLSPSQYRYFIDKARESGDPDAIFEFSLLLPRLDGRWPDPTQAPAFEGPSAEEAWIVAACRAGYDCARGARLMNLICLNAFACSQPDYQRHVASAGTPAQHAKRQQLLALIEGSILTPTAK